MAPVRRPVFWFIWPASEPGPVDSDAVQTRWTRVCGRGPWRWAFLIAFSLVVVGVVAAAISVVLSQPDVVTVLLGTIIVVPLTALLARAWVAGTYVSDRGVKVSRILVTEALPWSAVSDVVKLPGSRWLGTPLRVAGQRIAVCVTEDPGPSSTIRTDIESASPDLWLRPQAFDAAADRLRTWLRETRD
jgi:hypothetical protein